MTDNKADFANCNTEEFYRLNAQEEIFIPIAFERDDLEKVLAYQFDGRSFEWFKQYLFEEGSIFSMGKECIGLMRDLLPEFERWRQAKGFDA